jgi:hypothetical protein
MLQVRRLADGGFSPLTAAEIQSHPEFPHAYWDLKATKKDTIDVASGRGGPLKLAYEIHGHGPRKIVVSQVIPMWRLCQPSQQKAWQ